MSVHHFNTRVAEKVGVNAAVIAYAIEYWCQHKAANGKDIHDGKSWIYNSMKAWSELLPYLSEKQIRTALGKLQKEGIVEVRNLNEKQYDQTLWYAYVGLQTVVTIANRPNGQMELPKKANAIAPEGKSNCPKGQTNTNRIPNYIPNEDTDAFEDAWTLYRSSPLKANQTKKLAKAQWPKAVKKAGSAERILKAIESEVALRKKPKGFVANLPDMHRWLSRECWQDVEDRDPSGAKQELSREDWQAAFREFAESGTWLIPDISPPPTDPACKGPPEMIADYRKQHGEAA